MSVDEQIAGAAPGYDLALDASYNGLFQTPIVVARLKNPDALIADLKAAILARKANDPGLMRSNVGGWHSDAGMPQWGGDAARMLADTAVDMARNITHSEGYGWDKVGWAVQMWANVSGPGASNMLHVHPGNLWAAVFYVDLGIGDRAQEDVGGEIYFEDPRFPGAFMHAPSFRLRGPDGQPQHWQHDLRPRAGDLILFPSWLRHGVRPYRGDGERISIAMNLEPVPPQGGPR